MLEVVTCPTCREQIALTDTHSESIRCPTCKSLCLPANDQLQNGVVKQRDQIGHAFLNSNTLQVPAYSGGNLERPFTLGRVPGSATTMAAAIVLGLTVLCEVGGLVVEVTGAHLFVSQELRFQQGLDPEELGNPFDAFSLFLMLPTVVLFCMWMYRSYANLSHLRIPGLKYSPVYAVGSFFIPIVNLIRPCQIVQEMWQAANANAYRVSPREWKKQPGSLLVGIWWFFWIVGNIVGNIVFQMKLSENPPSEIAIVTPISTGLNCVTGILAVLVVIGLRRRQIELFNIYNIANSNFSNPNYRVGSS